jgi:hypothetical protein
LSKCHLEKYGYAGNKRMIYLLFIQSEFNTGIKHKMIINGIVESYKAESRRGFYVRISIALDTDITDYVRPLQHFIRSRKSCP